MSTAKKLPFPLHCYDEAGHLKPPLLLYVTCVWLAKALLLMLISVSMRENPSALIKLYYPDSQQWYVNAIPAIVGLAGFVLLSLRDKLRQYTFNWQGSVRLLLLGGLLLTISIQSLAIANNQGLFSWSHALSLMMSFLLIGYLLRSRRVGAYLKDK